MFIGIPPLGVNNPETTDPGRFSRPLPTRERKRFFRRNPDPLLPVAKDNPRSNSGLGRGVGASRERFGWPVGGLLADALEVEAPPSHGIRHLPRGRFLPPRWCPGKPSANPLELCVSTQYWETVPLLFDAWRKHVWSKNQYVSEKTQPPAFPFEKAPAPPVTVGSGVSPVPACPAGFFLRFIRQSFPMLLSSCEAAP